MAHSTIGVFLLPVYEQLKGEELYLPHLGDISERPKLLILHYLKYLYM